MSIEKEFLAEECGLDPDEAMADQGLVDLAQEDFDPLYECYVCYEQSLLSEFEDTENDGDVCGVCPKCGQHTMILEVTESFEMYKLEN